MGMTTVMLTGHAEWQGERFDFKIGEWAGGIGLMMRRTGHGSTKETGAGIWPTVEKAQAIADQTVKRLLSPECAISWMHSQAEAR
jgi:hypothetical protein